MTMDEVTATLVHLIRQTDLDRRPDLFRQSKIAFLDYLASALQAAEQPRVQKAARWVETFPGRAPLLGRSGTSHPIQAAFFNGFQSHYLDLDDAQASIAGHFSTVLFSVLLAESTADVTVKAFLTAYNVGAELEGILGGYLNPGHKRQGWHSTGTLGPIGGTGALASLKRLNPEETATLLSLGATQSAGLGLEAGSDAKPLHAGFAARNAVYAWELFRYTRVTASQRPFNNDNGWQQVFGNLTLDPEDLKEKWLNPGQIIRPGLWMKLHPYCSAAIGGAAACRELFRRGYTLDGLREVTFHFPPGGGQGSPLSGSGNGEGRKIFHGVCGLADPDPRRGRGWPFRTAPGAGSFPAGTAQTPSGQRSAPGGENRPPDSGHRRDPGWRESGSGGAGSPGKPPASLCGRGSGSQADPGQRGSLDPETVGQNGGLAPGKSGGDPAALV